MDVPDPGAIFPVSERGEVEVHHGGVELSWRDPACHENYTSVDSDPAAEPEVQRIVDSGFVKVFGSLEALRRARNI